MEKEENISPNNHIPVSILHKSIAGRYRPVRVADGPITASYRCIKNASWDTPPQHILLYNNNSLQTDRNVRKRMPGHVHPARIRNFSRRNLIAMDAKILHVDNEDSDPTARMRKLIWVFVGRTCQKFPHVAHIIRMISPREYQRLRVVFGKNCTRFFIFYGAEGWKTYTYVCFDQSSNGCHWC